MKKKIIIISILMIGLITFNNLNVKADSGFDASYGGSSYSGGSWSSGSSYSSRSSSWSSSRRNKSYSSSSSGTKKVKATCTSKECKNMANIMTMVSIILISIVPTIAFITFIISLIQMFINLFKRRGITNVPTSAHELYFKTDLTDSQIRETIPWFIKGEFLEESYNIYLKVQEDWMNFNYDGLKENLTNELYNEYKMQLESLKLRNRQNIMKDFKLIKAIITDVKEENEMYIITTEMLITFIDYITEHEIPIKGSVLSPITINYRMTFVRNNNNIDKCPNCGAPINENATQICEYCRGKIGRVGNKWVLSKKESLSQR